MAHAHTTELEGAAFFSQVSEEKEEFIPCN